MAQIHCVISEREMEWIIAAQHKCFSSRFYSAYIGLIDTFRYAQEIAKDASHFPKGTRSSHIIRFLISRKWIEQYKQENGKIVLPGKDIIKLNQHIVGYIECIHSEKFAAA